jgi:hypothetical protein
VGRFIPGKAELGFLNILASDEPLGKEAVDLNPETRTALGLDMASPDDLDRLEGAASGGEGQPVEPAPAPTAPASEPPQQPAAGVEAAPPAEPQEQEEPQAQAPSFEVGSLPADDAEPEPQELEDGEEAVAAPELPSRITHGKIFNARRTHPLRLIDVLSGKYGGEWAMWEPETMWWAIRRDFGPVGEITRNKLGALRVAVKTDLPWLDWDIFEDTGLAWNDIIPIFGAYQPMTPSQCAFAIQVLRELRDEEFAPEVVIYMAAILDEAGFVYVPEEWFPGAQAQLDKKDWLMGLKSDVEAAWAKVQNVDPTQIEWTTDSQLDIHLVKLFVIKVYLAERALLRRGNPADERPASAASTTASPPVP